MEEKPALTKKKGDDADTWYKGYEDSVLYTSLAVLEDRLKQKRELLAKLKAKAESLPEEEGSTDEMSLGIGSVAMPPTIAPVTGGDQIAVQYVSVLAVNTNPDGSVGFVTPDPRALSNAEMKLSVKALEDAISDIEMTMEELRRVFKEDIRQRKEKGDAPTVVSDASKKADTKLKLEMAKRLTEEGSLAPPSTPVGAESPTSTTSTTSPDSPTVRPTEHKRAKSDKDVKDKSSAKDKNATPRDKRSKSSRSRENSVKEKKEKLESGGKEPTDSAPVERVPLPTPSSTDDGKPKSTAL